MAARYTGLRGGFQWPCLWWGDATTAASAGVAPSQRCCGRGVLACLFRTQIFKVGSIGLYSLIGRLRLLTCLTLPLLLPFSSRSDWLAPYCYFTFLAGTQNYMAGIHNYFFTFRTMTTVHRGLPLGGCYCTISFLFSSILPTQRAMQAPQGLSLGEPRHPRADCAGTFQVVTALFDFWFFFLSRWVCVTTLR